MGIPFTVKNKKTLEEEKKELLEREKRNWEKEQEFKAQKTVEQAVDKALAEYRTWKDIEDRSGEDNLPVSVQDDNSWVYHATEAEEEFLAPTIWVKNDKEKLKGIEKRIKLKEGDWVLLGTSGKQDAKRVITTSELFDFQDAVFNKYHSDPHVRSAINNVKFFTIGKGIRFEAANEQVQEKLLEFWNINDMDARYKNIVKDSYMEGEYFILYFVNKISGKIIVRKIRAKQITDVETHPEDIETILSYQRTLAHNDIRYYKDINYESFINEPALDKIKSKAHSQLQTDKYIQYIKYGEDDEARGRVPLDTVLTYCKLYKDWVYDRARLNHERAKVVWIKKYERRNRGKEANTSVMRSPKGGIMLIETPNVSYRIENPKIEASQAKDDGLAIQYMIAAGTGQPLFLLSQRASEEVYASVKKAGTPFSQSIQDNQDFHSNNMEKMFKFVIRINIQAGKLPKTVKVPKFSSMEKLEEIQKQINEMVVGGKTDEEIIKEIRPLVEGQQKYKSVPTETVNITRVFPDPVREDIFDQARVLEIHRRIGIASIQSLSERAGYNWQQELYRMSLDVRNNEEPEEHKRSGNDYPDDKGDVGDKYKRKEK